MCDKFGGRPLDRIRGPIPAARGPSCFAHSRGLRTEAMCDKFGGRPLDRIRGPIPAARGPSCFAHSITSPRKRNFAIAAVLTKPNSAISSAASKYMLLV